MVNILDAIRVIFNLSKFMIGLTIGAWGNSIGDFLSNLSMAKNGFPRMAISACFGGPVLSKSLLLLFQETVKFLIFFPTTTITIIYRHVAWNWNSIYDPVYTTTNISD